MLLTFSCDAPKDEYTGMEKINRIVKSNTLQSSDIYL